MKEREVKGMFSGPLVPLLIRLSLPVLAGMLFQLLFNIVDTLFVSRIDVDDVSIVGSVGLIFPVMFIFIALASGLMVGVSSLVARSIGKRDEKMLSTVVESGLVLAGIIAIILTFVGYLGIDKIVALLGNEKSQSFIDNGIIYLKWLLPCMIPVFIGQVFYGIFQGEGFPKFIMISMIVGTCANLILDPLLIYKDFSFSSTFPFVQAGGIRMGIAGAALATTISQFLGVGVIILAFFLGKSSFNIKLSVKNITKSAIAGILKIGFPMFLAQGTMALAMMIYNKIMIGFDEVAVSAYAYVSRVDQAILMPSMALSSALVTVVGQNFGRGNLLRVRKAWRTGIVMGMVVVFVVATLHIIFARQIYNFMTGGNQAIVNIAVLQVYIMEYSFIASVVGIGGRGVFQGLGKPLPSVILTMLRTLGFGLLFTFIFVVFFDMEVEGVYWGVVCGNILISAVAPFWIERTISRLIKEKKNEYTEN